MLHPEWTMSKRSSCMLARSTLRKLLSWCRVLRGTLRSAASGLSHPPIATSMLGNFMVFGTSCRLAILVLVSVQAPARQGQSDIEQGSWERQFHHSIITYVTHPVLLMKRGEVASKLPDKEPKPAF